MATVDKLTQALIAADKAGNTDDARVLAKELAAARAAPAPQVGTAHDVVHSILPGLTEGATGTAGSASDLFTGFGGMAPYINAALAKGGSTERVPSSTAQGLIQLLQKVAGPMYESKTVPGQYARTIASFVPAAAAGPEGIGPKIASAVLPATGDEALGQLSKGTKYEGIMRTIGSILGGGTAGVRIRAPELPSMLGDVSPETANLFQQMTKLGVNIRPAQAAPSGFVKTADSELQRLPFTGYGKGDLPTNAQQISQMTQALLKTTGSNAPVANDAAMASIKKNLGDTYQTIFGRNSIALTPDFTDKLNQIGRDAQENLLGDGDKVANAIQAIKTKAQDGGGSLTGQQYQNMRQQGGPIYQIAKSTDPGISFWGKNLRSALDSEFVKQADPTDAALLKLTNKQYQNYKILEPLADKAAVGQLSPQLLLSQVNKHGGSGDIQTLARGAQAFLKEPPNSMTAERGQVLKSLTSPVTLGAGLLGTGAMFGGADAGLASIPLALLTSRTLKNVVNSKAAQRQLMGAPAPDPMLSYTNPYPAVTGP